MIDHRKIIDHLTSALYEVDKLAEKPSPRIEKEEALGLSFRKGRKVKDKVTGKRGEVLFGTIKRVSKS